jgi:hypothetical protein
MAIQRSTLDADTSFDPKTLIIRARFRCGAAIGSGPLSRLSQLASQA